jgi:hypothetical protein
MKIPVFRDVTRYGLIDVKWCFEGTCIIRLGECILKIEVASIGWRCTRLQGFTSQKRVVFLLPWEARIHERRNIGRGMPMVPQRLEVDAVYIRTCLCFLPAGCYCCSAAVSAWLLRVEISPRVAVVGFVVYIVALELILLRVGSPADFHSTSSLYVFVMIQRRYKKSVWRAGWWSGARFESLAWNRLVWLRVLMIFLSPSRKMVGL